MQEEEIPKWERYWSNICKILTYIHLYIVHLIGNPSIFFKSNQAPYYLKYQTQDQVRLNCYSFIGKQEKLVGNEHDTTCCELWMKFYVSKTQDGAWI